MNGSVRDSSLAALRLDGGNGAASNATVRFRDGIWRGNELSPEMLSLALDTACLGSAHLIGLSAVMLTDLSSDARRYHDNLLKEAAIVHNAARMVHGLD